MIAALCLAIARDVPAGQHHLRLLPKLAGQPKLPDAP